MSKNVEFNLETVIATSAIKYINVREWSGNKH